MMFNALLLQSWYNLSDPQLEQQLARELLLRRFVGIRLDTLILITTAYGAFAKKSVKTDGLIIY